MKNLIDNSVSSEICATSAMNGDTNSQGPQLPQWLSTDLVLGIVGTVTGVLSLLIHLIRLRREKPNLALEPLRCMHRLSKNKAGGASVNIGTLIEMELRVNNRGDWDTTVNDVQLAYSDYSSAREKLKAGGVEVPKHGTKTLVHSFFIPGKEINEPTIDCKLTLYHTQGAQTFHIVSNIRQKS